MSAKLYGLYGSSGFGQEILYWLDLALKRAGDSSRVVFIDDVSQESTCAGRELFDYDGFLAQPEETKLVVIAVASSPARQRIDEQLCADGIEQLAIRGDYTFVRGATFAAGSVLSAFVDVTNNIQVGRCCHINTYTYIGHDCVIGDYVTFAPRVSCNGNVHIGDHAYIGTGAILKQGTKEKPLVIGEGAVVGMGAVVTKDVPPGVTVVGNPAKPLVRK